MVPFTSDCHSVTTNWILRFSFAGEEDGLPPGSCFVQSTVPSIPFPSTPTLAWAFELSPVRMVFQLGVLETVFEIGVRFTT